MTPAVKSAVKAIAKRINYEGSIYTNLIDIQDRRGKATAAKYLEKRVRELSEDDVKTRSKTDKYHYKLSVALFDFLDWEEVLSYVFDYDIQAEESRKPDVEYSFIFKPY